MNRILSILALLALLVMAGCGAAPTAGSPPTTAPAAAPTTAAAAPTTAAAEPNGEPIVIAVPTDLGAIEPKSSLNAVLMAVEEINAAGGVNVGGQKRPFKVVSTDTRDGGADVPVDDALQAMERMILEQKPAAILVGNLRSEVLIAAMDLMTKYKLPYIATIAATPAMQQKVTENYDKYKYMFRAGLNGPGVGMYLSQAMGFMGKEFGFKRVYIVHQDVAWAKGTADGLEKWFQGNGWQVVGKDPYPTGATEFTPSINKAIEAKADVILPLFDMPSSGTLLKQAKAMQAPPLFAGFISPVAPQGGWDTFEGDVANMVNLSFEIGNLPVAAVPASVQFYDKYGQKYGASELATLGGHGPAPSYDSVYILKAAIERAGSLDGDALVKALEATDMDGAIGHIKFGKDHQVVYGLDPKTTALGAVFQWRDKKRVPVFPPAVAEAKIELPTQ